MNIPLMCDMKNDIKIFATSDPGPKYTTFENEDHKWMIRINHTDGKIEVNDKDFPEMTPNDFVKEFIRILKGSGLVPEIK